MLAMVLYLGKLAQYACETPPAASCSAHASTSPARPPMRSETARGNAQARGTARQRQARRTARQRQAWHLHIKLRPPQWRCISVMLLDMPAVTTPMKRLRKIRLPIRKKTMSELFQTAKIDADRKKANMHLQARRENYRIFN